MEEPQATRINNMAVGRPPKPKHILELAGSKHAKNREELGKIVSNAPEPPDWLTDAAKAMFRKVCSYMVTMGTLAESDYEVIVRYSIVWDRWQTAERMLAQGCDSYVETFNPDGSLKLCRASKWQLQSNDCHEKLRQFESVLGLTPADRTRLGYGAVKVEDDPLAEFLPVDKTATA